MITKREQDIYNFLDIKENGGEGFHIATSSQLHQLFFSQTTNRYSQKRLAYLVKQGFLKRRRSTIDNGYAYYIPGTTSLLQQVHHDLIRTELYLHIKEKYKVIEWNNECTIEHIRPDVVAFIEDHGIAFPVLVEIHLNNRFDFDKYKTLLKTTDLRAMFGLMPRVLICTDRQVTVPAGLLKYKIINFNTMAGLESLFK